MTITPGTPGFIGGKVDDISKVDEKTQSMYRSGVGTLLYLTKHSRPDITNPVRVILIKGECMENILHNSNFCAYVSKN